MLSGAVLMPHPPVIIPEVGKESVKKAEKTISTAIKAKKIIKEMNPDILVIMSPHHTVYADYFQISRENSLKGDAGQFGAPQLTMELDTDREFIKEIIIEAENNGIPAGTLGGRPGIDHGTFVPLYFLGTDIPVISMGISGLPLKDHYKMGKIIADVAEKTDKKVVFVASGDLSHKVNDNSPYGSSPEGIIYDKKITDILKKGNFIDLLTMPTSLIEEASECGHRSIAAMAGFLDGKDIETPIINYEAPFGIGYCVCVFKSTGENKKRRFLDSYEKDELKKIKAIRQNEDSYVSLARKALEYYVKTGENISEIEEIDKELLKLKAGTFVTLTKDGGLRGCIGTIAPTTPCVANEIIKNAIKAGTEDPRFPPVKEDEIPFIKYTVSILETPEKIDSENELDPSKYGIIVEKGFKRGLLLPNIEGVNTVDEQVKIAKRKAGMSPNERNVKLRRFEVMKHE